MTTTITGTGFLALDVLESELSGPPARTWAGGSFGNVLAIMAYLGWRSLPVSVLGLDTAGKRAMEDMGSVGVDTRFVQQVQGWQTPLVLQRIYRTIHGRPASRFVWTCPHCGRWLPRYRPLRLADARLIAAQLPDHEVFYFDRVSPGVLQLAEASLSRGALVVFEPTSVGDERLFTRALALAHVVKYSNDRLPGIGEFLSGPEPNILIETMGADGLRYKFGHSQGAPWRALLPFEIENVRDSVGAGDWCTAGFLYKAAQHGRAGFDELPRPAIESALQFGQALGALACTYEGARGPMYALTKSRLLSAVAKIEQDPVRTRARPQDPTPAAEWSDFCPSCVDSRSE